MGTCHSGTILRRIVRMIHRFYDSRDYFLSYVSDIAPLNPCYVAMGRLANSGRDGTVRQEVYRGVTRGMNQALGKGVDRLLRIRIVDVLRVLWRGRTALSLWQFGFSWSKRIHDSNSPSNHKVFKWLRMLLSLRSFHSVYVYGPLH